MTKLPAWFRVIFILLMLCTAFVLIWQVPAVKSLNATIAEKRNELSVLKGQVRYQEKISHVHMLDDIESYQDSLDTLLTPELDGYLRAYTTRKNLVSLKSELNAEIRSLEDEKDELENPYVEDEQEEDGENE